MKSVREILHDKVEAMRGVAVGVVGDLVADVYVYARPSKLSREAPVVIARHEFERVVPGGGANVLANLAALGAAPHAFGRVGDDPAGVRLAADLSARGVDVGALSRSGETVTLTRYMVGSANTRKQQVLRVDRFSDASPAPALKLPDTLAGWIASDYSYGAITESLCRELAARAAAGTPVVGDSRQNLPWYRGFTLVKPNLSEAEGWIGHALVTDDQITAAALRLRGELGLAGVLITLGNLGMVLASADCAPRQLAAVGAREAVDVSGAGDTVCAVITLALAAGCDLSTAAVLANRGAAVVVMHEGTTPLTAAELHQAIDAGGDEAREPDLALLCAAWKDGANG